MSAAAAPTPIGPALIGPALIGPAWIGPNAVTQLAHALREARGEPVVRELFARADCSEWLEAPPTRMVPEPAVVRLHGLLHERLPGAAAAEIERAAGLATGDYLLAHRIPRAAQALLGRLPAALAARLLLAAIRRHAWTFAGSGEFDGCATGLGGVRLEIRGCPMCRDRTARDARCDYYAATFERLFGRLVSPRTRVEQVGSAAGGGACRFELRW